MFKRDQDHPLINSSALNAFRMIIGADATEELNAIFIHMRSKWSKLTKEFRCCKSVLQVTGSSILRANLARHGFRESKKYLRLDVKATVNSKLSNSKR